MRGVRLVNADLTGATLYFTPIATTLEGANLTNANLTDAFMPFANLTGATLSNNTNLNFTTYDEFTLFPSGTDIYDYGFWGPPGNETPWDLGMIPLSEPAGGLMVGVGSFALAGLANRRRLR